MPMLAASFIRLALVLSHRSCAPHAATHFAAFHRVRQWRAGNVCRCGWWADGLRIRRRRDPQGPDDAWAMALRGVKAGSRQGNWAASRSTNGAAVPWHALSQYRVVRHETDVGSATFMHAREHAMLALVADVARPISWDLFPRTQPHFSVMSLIDRIARWAALSHVERVGTDPA